jgi:hypothetical protein
MQKSAHQLDRFDGTVQLALPLADRPVRCTAIAVAALSASNSANGRVGIGYDPGSGSLGKDRGAWIFPERIDSLLSVPVTRTPCILATHNATVCKFLTAMGASGD